MGLRSQTECEKPWLTQSSRCPVKTGVSKSRENPDVPKDTRPPVRTFAELPWAPSWMPRKAACRMCLVTGGGSPPSLILPPGRSDPRALWKYRHILWIPGRNQRDTQPQERFSLTFTPKVVHRPGILATQPRNAHAMYFVDSSIAICVTVIEQFLQPLLR